VPIPQNKTTTTTKKGKSGPDYCEGPSVLSVLKQSSTGIGDYLKNVSKDTAKAPNLFLVLIHKMTTF
jgi:hypothetical protein